MGKRIGLHAENNFHQISLPILLHIYSEGIQRKSERKSFPCGVTLPWERAVFKSSQIWELEKKNNNCPSPHPQVKSRLLISRHSLAAIPTSCFPGAPWLLTAAQVPRASESFHFFLDFSKSYSLTYCPCLCGEAEL